jgi:hypothetical protein
MASTIKGAGELLMSSTSEALPQPVAPTTPDQWRDLLLAALQSRMPLINRLDSYYRGEHKLLFATAKFREVFGILFASFSDNWCDLVVDASAERLKIEGFRFGSDGAADGDAWEIFQRNDLDAESGLAHTEAVKLGCTYALVTPDKDGQPQIQIEPPSNAIVALDPAQGRKRLAGLRYWLDELGIEHCVLYLPSDVYWWQRTSSTYASQWQNAEGTGSNPLGVVPLVPIANAPTLVERQGRSDIERVIPLQDAVNKLCADMIVASEYAAFPQRWATGVEIPVYPPGSPNAGQPMPEMMGFLSGADRVWTSEEFNARFGNFQTSDLTIYVKAIEMYVQHIAAQTRTPPHYLLGQSGSFPSGESLKATETGLVAKVRKKQLHFGEGWEEVVRLAFQILGDDDRANAWDCETIWANPESRSLAETTDAAVKMSSIGVPRPALWEFIGATPQQIEQWIAMGATIAGPPVVARETIAATATPEQLAVQLAAPETASERTSAGLPSENSITGGQGA